MQLPLSLLVGAAITFYLGTHLLWQGFGGHRARSPMARGMLIAMPMVLIAIWMAIGDRAVNGIAILMTGATLLLTLTLGVCAISNPHNGTLQSPTLRLLAPLAAATFVIGLSGELNLTHAICLAAMTIVLLWTLPPKPDGELAAVKPALTAAGSACLIVGAAAMILAVTRLMQLPIVPLAGPVVVPLVLLASVGLLVGDVHAGAGESAVDTIVGAAIALLGIGIPLAIVAAHVVWFSASPTQPATQPAIVMPIASWRIDSVLITLLSILLLPVSLGRFSLSRLEGFLLVLACMGYMYVTVLTARG